MWTLGPLGFTAPLLLLGLIVLPILWLLLRAVPPAPVKRRFPGVALLLGLQDDESQSDRTPWWLLLLRLIAVAALIIGFAGPVLNPTDSRAGTGNLLIALDGSWAGAPSWTARIKRVDALLSEAMRELRRSLDAEGLLTENAPMHSSTRYRGDFERDMLRQSGVDMDAGPNQVVHEASEVLWRPGQRRASAQRFGGPLLGTGKLAVSLSCGGHAGC